MMRVATPLYYVEPGFDVSTPPLLEANSSDSVMLLRLCQATESCAGFTVGSGGGKSPSRDEGKHSPLRRGYVHSSQGGGGLSDGLVLFERGRHADGSRGGASSGCRALDARSLEFLSSAGAMFFL